MLSLLHLTLALAATTSAFPSFLAKLSPKLSERESSPESLAWSSLAHLSPRELEHFVRATSATLAGASPAPGPQSDTSSKLVNDASHPFQATGTSDQRGPCPGLNTLANHGYLNRNGIVTPQDIVNGVQQGFNMGNDLAVMVAWGAHLVDGNQLTNLMSIGGKSSATGTDPPPPAQVGGLNVHGTFEGDASTTRGDYAFGDNHSFNETLFQVLVSKSKQYGGGQYNRAAAAEVRYARIQDSMARNPSFDFTTPRYYTAYAESIFPYVFFVDGQSGNNGSLDLSVARSFFQDSRMPSNFYRRGGAFGLASMSGDLNRLMQAHPVQPGYNTAPGQYVADKNDPSLTQGVCGIYTKHTNVTVRSLYPNPTGDLRTALKANLRVFYSAFKGVGCTELFPYGQ